MAQLERNGATTTTSASTITTSTSTSTNINTQEKEGTESDKDFSNQEGSSGEKNEINSPKSEVANTNGTEGDVANGTQQGKPPKKCE